MNYRIDGENEVIRPLAESDQLDALVALDQVNDSPKVLIMKRSLDRRVSSQLRSAMDSRQAFSGYEEGPLLFRPTYRYDLGTDRYDTSEKARIPAWTGGHCFFYMH